MIVDLSQDLLDTESEYFKILLPIIGAVAGGVATYLVERGKRKRDPRREVSWSARTEVGLPRADGALEEHLSVLYKGHAVQGLAVINCKITNTGNRAVKHQLVRFEVPDGSTFIEAVCEPPPQREMGVQRNPELEESHREVVLTIGQMEKGRDINVRLLATGDGAKNWVVYGHNDAGDVAFEERDAVRERDDAEHVTPFITLLLLLIAAQLVLSTPLLGSFTEALRLLATISVLALIAPHAAPAARIVQGLVSQRNGCPRPTQSIVTGDISTLNIASESRQSR